MLMVVRSRMQRSHHGIAVDGLVLNPLPHDQPIRYLGVHTSFDGSWSAQQNKSRSMIMTFTRLAIKFHLTVSETVYMFNVFLITRLELALEPALKAPWKSTSPMHGTLVSQ
jgi:hypothetical protein